MNKKIKRLLGFILQLSMLFLGYYYGFVWALEVVLIIIAFDTYKNEVAIKKEFEASLPEFARIVTPLKAKMYELPMFALLSTGLILTVTLSLSHQKNSFQDILLIFIISSSLIPILIKFLYQLAFPRKLYTDDHFIYYNTKKIIKIPWTDIEEIELSNTLITFYEKDYKNVLFFNKALTEADFIEWNDFLTQGVQQKDYKYINATRYKRLKNNN